MRSARATLSDPRRLLGVCAIVICLAYTAALARFSLQGSEFIGDDLISFWQSRTLPFWAFIRLPLDVHPVPLHRLVAYLVGRAVPVKFWLAVLILATFQTVAILALYRTLEGLKASRGNAVFVVWYATYLYLGSVFVWWTAGLHRLPYLCFLSLALYHYVRYRNQHRSRDALGVVVSLTLALGFFEKGLLIPLFLVGAEACHWRTTPPAARKKNALFLGGLILFVAVYFQIWRHAVGEQWSTVVTGPRFLFDYTKVSWTVLLRGTVGRVDDGTGIAIAVWVVILGAAVLRARTALAAVLVGFVSVSLSLVVTGLSSNRSAVFGLNLPVLNQRYYPDAMFVLALFAAIAWQQGATSGDASASVAVRRREWAVTIVLVGGMIVGALTSYGVSTWRTALAYPAQARTRAFLQTLNGELRRLHADGTPLRFVQGKDPLFLDMGFFDSHSLLLEALGVDATICRPGPGCYRIDGTGLILPTKPRARRVRR